MVLTGAKARLIESVSRFSSDMEKINLIVTKLFLDGCQCGRFKSIIACPCSMLSLQSDHTNASYLLIPPLDCEHHEGTDSVLFSTVSGVCHIVGAH